MCKSCDGVGGTGVCVKENVAYFKVCTAEKGGKTYSRCVTLDLDLGGGPV